MKLTHVLLCAIAACPFMAVTATAGIVERSFSVSEGGTLNVTADASSIHITTHSGNEVEVSISSSALDEFDISFEQHGGDVDVDVEIERTSRRFFSFFNSNRQGCRIEVCVPDRYNATLTTSGGKIAVDDLYGHVACKTSGGSISLGNIHGPVDAKTSGGGITMGSIDGDIEAKTSGGSIRLEHATGDVNLRTSGGSIHAGEVTGSVRASTSGGSVTAYISEQPARDCRLTTSGGSVTVHVNPDLRLSINARSSGGKVECRNIMVRLGDHDNNKLVADMNGGGPELYLQSSGGGVRIETP